MSLPADKLIQSDVVPADRRFEDRWTQTEKQPSRSTKLHRSCSPSVGNTTTSAAASASNNLGGRGSLLPTPLAGLLKNTADGEGTQNECLLHYSPRPRVLERCFESSLSMDESRPTTIACMEFTGDFVDAGPLDPDPSSTEDVCPFCFASLSLWRSATELSDPICCDRFDELLRTALTLEDHTEPRSQQDESVDLASGARDRESHPPLDSEAARDAAESRLMARIQQKKLSLLAKRSRSLQGARLSNSIQFSMSSPRCIEEGWLHVPWRTESVDDIRIVPSARPSDGLVTAPATKVRVRFSMNADMPSVKGTRRSRLRQVDSPPSRQSDVYRTHAGCD